MTSTYTDLGVELMVTGENAGTWGTKTNTNLNLIEQISNWRKCWYLGNKNKYKFKSYRTNFGWLCYPNFKCCRHWS